jgi:hypothetical protein
MDQRKEPGPATIFAIGKNIAEIWLPGFQRPSSKKGVTGSANQNPAKSRRDLLVLNRGAL